MGFLAGIVSAACAAGGDRDVAQRPSSSSPDATSECSAGAAESAVRDFLDLYNAGDSVAAAGMFATPEEGFEWYSDSPDREAPSGDSSFSDPYDRASLEDYFEHMAEQGDYMRLRHLSLTSATVDSHDYAIEVTRPGGVSKGKFVWSCARQEFLVWSLGLPAEQ